MSLFSGFLKRQSRSRSTARAARSRTMRRLRLERLEGRSLLAQLTVTTPLDVLDPDDGLLSLREAVIQANSTQGADTINVPAGTYTLSLAAANEDAALTGDLDLTGHLTIQGDGAGATIIDGAGLDRVFDVHEGGTVTISDVTITGGAALAWWPDYSGGGIRSFGTLAVNRTTLLANAAGNGGGIASEQGTLTVSNCVFSDNTATDVSGGGGAIGYHGTSMTVRDTTFHGNSALGTGGAISHASNYVFDPKKGFTLDGDSTVMNSTFSNNTAYAGGGIDNFGSLRVVNSTFTANSAAKGGAVHHDRLGDLTVLDSTFTGNSAVRINDEYFEGIGGGIYFFTNEGQLVVNGCSFSDNFAEWYGGGIWNYNDGDVASKSVVMNSTFTGNIAGLDGGGIWSFQAIGPLTIRGTILAGNFAGNFGGGIWNAYDLIVQDSHVIENEALFGDDIYNSGSLKIIDSVIGEMFP